MEFPEVKRQRAFAFYQFTGFARVVDNCLDFATMPHDARILQQTLHVFFGEFGNLLEIELRKRRAEMLSLGKDGASVQARLKGFEAQLFKEAMVVADGKASLGVVVVEELGSRATPAAAGLVVGRGEGGHGVVNCSSIPHIEDFTNDKFDCA